MKKGYNTIYIDIMVDGRFYKQIPYVYNPLWKLDEEDARKKVLDAYPTLALKNYELRFSQQRIAR